MRCSWIILALVVGAGCSSARTSEAPAPAPGAPSATNSVTAAAPPNPAMDSVTRERARYVAEVRQQIAGKETLPASQVFKNVKVLGQVPAGRLLAIMNTGYGKSLGVSCTHCHVAGQWDSEEKTQKQTTRDMTAMAAAINNELLKKIPNLKGPDAVVNCTTCHRGQVKPALNIP
jgi:hypothetical protein